MARGGNPILTPAELETLGDFLRRTEGMTVNELAEVMKASPLTVQGWRDGKIPKKKTIEKMYEYCGSHFIPFPKEGEDPQPSEEPKGKLIAMTDEEEKLFRYMFRVFIEKYHTLAFDTVEVKKVVAFARTILNDELVDGILINRITREEK